MANYKAGKRINLNKQARNARIRASIQWAVIALLASFGAWEIMLRSVGL